MQYIHYRRSIVDAKKTTRTHEREIEKLPSHRDRVEHW